jgi:hypothetical protein
MDFSSIPFVANMTPAAGGGFRADYRGADRISGASGSDDVSMTLPIGAASERDVLYVFVSAAMSATSGTRSATLGGQTGTQIGFLRPNVGVGRLCEATLWKFTGVTGDSPATFESTVTGGGNWFQAHAACFTARDVGSENVVLSSDILNSDPRVVSQNLISGDFVAAQGTAFANPNTSNDGGGNWDVVGLSATHIDRRTRSDEAFGTVFVGSHAATSTENPRTITLLSATTIEMMAAISLGLRA